MFDSKTNQRLKDLKERIATEQDANKFSELMAELNRVLDEHERLKLRQPPDTNLK